LGFIAREARLQDVKNRQASIEIDDDVLSQNWKQYQEYSGRVALDTYKWAIENGIAKEQARAVLPEGMTESVMIMAGSLRSWVHYCQLRMGPETQKEHRIVAEQCWEIITERFPAIIEALKNE
jgi:thymidylate synthase (FAD)